MKSETIDLPAEELLQAKRQAIAGFHSHASDYLSERALGDGRAIWLMAMFGGNLRIGVGTLGSCSFDNEWCFHDHDAAWRAAFGWNGHGDPEGWYRHPQSGRRRPGGDPEKEFVAP